MIKILHVLATPRAEGTPNLVLDWLMTDLHQQEVFALNAKPADLTFNLKEKAYWYNEADSGLLNGWREFPRIYACIRRVCLERKPDLLIIWPMGLAGWIAAGAKMAGVKQILVHCGNPPTRGLKADWVSRYVLWPLWLLRAKVICCSGYVRDELLAIPAVSLKFIYAVHNCSRSELIRKRANAARVEMEDKSGQVGVMVATLEKHKDHETLLQAMTLVLKEKPGFQLNLVGDGSLQAHLKSRVVDLGLQKAVNFLGTRRDVPEILGRSDLFIFSTTYQEGLGSVLLEALAAGLPVIASDVPACNETLEGGKWGDLVAPGDAVKLAQAIVKRLISVTVDDKVLTQRLEYLGRFTPERMMANYLAIAASDN